MGMLVSHSRKIARLIRNPLSSFVFANRHTGKTHGLVNFVAERTLTSPTEAEIVVICGSQHIAEVFLLRFRESYPKMRLPTVHTPYSASILLRGKEPEQLEIYVDEPFFFDATGMEKLRDIHHKYGIRGGVGSIPEAVGLPIDTIFKMWTV